MNKTLRRQEGEGAHGLKSGALNMQPAWTWSSRRWPKGSVVGLTVLNLALPLVDTFPR